METEVVDGDRSLDRSKDGRENSLPFRYLICKDFAGKGGESAWKKGEKQKKSRRWLEGGQPALIE